MTKNIVWHDAAVTHDDRVAQKRHQPALLWYTGLSGSGKSTIANAVDRKLFELGRRGSCQVMRLLKYLWTRR